MKLGSLCSGAGGLDLAVERVFGAETVWHCELDPAASKVLAHRWPGVPNHGDLITTDWSQVEPVDIICAGWPCQPFSMAGKRKGLDDERAIWPHIATAVRLVRPRYVVLENVTAVLVREFGRVADSLAALGYDLRWTCLRAFDVGAPHRRERLFIIAANTERIRRNSGISRPSFARVQTGGSSNRNGATVAHASGDGRHKGRPESAGFVGGSDAALSGDGPINLLPTPTAQSAKHDADDRGPGTLDDFNLWSVAARIGRGELLPLASTQDQKEGPLRGLRNDREPARSPQGSESREQRSAEPGSALQFLPQETAPAGGPRVHGAPDTGSRWGRYEAAIRRWEAILGRPAPDPTEPNRNGNPRLNPEFSSWMMGWPAGWVTDVPGLARNDQLRIIGNGVVPPQAIAALSWLLSLEAVA